MSKPTFYSRTQNQQFGGQIALTAPMVSEIRYFQPTQIESGDILAADHQPETVPVFVLSAGHDVGRGILAADAIHASLKVSISRPSGSSYTDIARDLPAAGAQIDDQFHKILNGIVDNHAKPTTDTFRAIGLRSVLTAALEHLDNSDELHRILKQRVDAHDSTFRAIVQTGTAVQVADRVTLLDGRYATVKGIDRLALTGLQVLGCSPLQDPVKLNPLKRLFSGSTR